MTPNTKQQTTKEPWYHYDSVLILIHEPVHFYPNLELRGARQMSCSLCSALFSRRQAPEVNSTRRIVDGDLHLSAPRT